MALPDARVCGGSISLIGLCFHLKLPKVYRLSAVFTRVFKRFAAFE